VATSSFTKIKQQNQVRVDRAIAIVHNQMATFNGPQQRTNAMPSDGCSLRQSATYTFVLEDEVTPSRGITSATASQKFAKHFRPRPFKLGLPRRPKTSATPVLKPPSHQRFWAKRQLFPQRMRPSFHFTPVVQ
jgi:hypothetical protein